MNVAFLQFKNSFKICGRSTICVSGFCSFAMQQQGKALLKDNSDY
jgi:hypothetical protein